MYKGIDISHWQGSIDFNQVKEDGIKFAIIKAGGCDQNTNTSDSTYKDFLFDKNYWGAIKAGLHVGAYYFAGKYFVGAAEGEKCAERFLKIIAGKLFDMPLFIDIEITNPKYKKEVTDATKAFCDCLESWGYWAGIYASDVSGYQDRLYHDDLNRYTHWVARYGKKPEVCRENQIWQKSDQGKVKGINCNVDIDETVVAFWDIIRRKGLNGFEGYM